MVSTQRELLSTTHWRSVCVPSVSFYLALSLPYTILMEWVEYCRVLLKELLSIDSQLLYLAKDISAHLSGQEQNGGHM